MPPVLPEDKRFQQGLKAEIQNQHDNVNATKPGEDDDYTSVAS